MSTIPSPPALQYIKTDLSNAYDVLIRFDSWMKYTLLPEVNHFDSLSAENITTVTGTFENSTITDPIITGGTINSVNTTDISGWAHVDDNSKMDGEDIYANTITTTPLTSSVTNRLFTNDDYRGYVEGWIHGSDNTKFDGADIYNGTVSSGQIDSSVWTTLVDHNTIVNNHNLTTDIDHDQLTNFSADEHFTEASIDHGSISGKDDDDHTQYALADASRTFSTGVTGWIDDGANFRMTVTSGIITNIGTTVSGGYSMT